MLVGLKVASDSARALPEEGEVVQDLLNPRTGNREPSRPGIVGPFEPPEPLVGVDAAVEDVGVEDRELDAEEGAGAAEPLTTFRGGLLADGDGVEAVTAGQRRCRTGLAVVKTTKQVRKRIMDLEENMAIEVSSGSDKGKKES